MTPGATLRSIAAACGVDVSTVSRALRGDARVAPATVALVQAEAARQGYRPNLAARALRTQATRTVWCILGSLDYEFELTLANAAEPVMAEAGFDLLIACHRNEAGQLERLLGRVDLGLADGALVIAPSITGPTGPALASLEGRRFPLVFLDRAPAGDHPLVTTDNAAAARELVRRLAAAGARCLAISPDSPNEVARARQEAAQAEAAAIGLPVRLDPDAAWFAAAPEPIGLFATSQQTVHLVCTRHAAVLRGKALRFAVFDRWTGEPHPAPLALVAVQDFPALARRAARRVLATIDDPTAWSPAAERLPPLRTDTVTASF